MLAADDTVKITDFGTAKILQFGSTQQTSHVMGTPSYMSPEQVKGRGVRSEEHTSELQSRGHLVCRLLLEKKKKKQHKKHRNQHSVTTTDQALIQPSKQRTRTR